MEEFILVLLIIGQVGPVRKFPAQCQQLSVCRRHAADGEHFTGEAFIQRIQFKRLFEGSATVTPTPTVAVTITGNVVVCVGVRASAASHIEFLGSNVLDCCVRARFHLLNELL